MWAVGGAVCILLREVGGGTTNVSMAVCVAVEVTENGIAACIIASRVAAATEFLA